MRYVVNPAVNSALNSSVKAGNSGPNKGFPCLLSLVHIISVKPSFVVTHVFVFSVNK